MQHKNNTLTADLYSLVHSASFESLMCFSAVNKEQPAKKYTVHTNDGRNVRRGIIFLYIIFIKTIVQLSFSL